MNKKYPHLGLSQEEMKWIVANPKQCEVCCHLLIFHYHDKEYGPSFTTRCLVDDCNCEQ